MSYNTILFEEKIGIAYITINQPKSLNALNTEVLTELGQAVQTIKESETIKVVILTGAGEKSFVAGANIVEMSTKNAKEGQVFSLLGNRIFEALATLDQPSIAAVNGFALGGGCELAMSCDLRIASENALFGQPEVGLGITPGFGGTQRLARIVGIAKAKELIYTASNIKAAEAERIGLVNKVVPQEELMAEAEKLAGKILKQSQTAVQKAKIAIDLGIELPLHRAVEVEAEMFGNLFATEDQKEGMAAFVEKRKPEFTGK